MSAVLPPAPSRTESTHHRLYDFAKSALVKIFSHPYATVCDLYCGGGADAELWETALINHYIGIDVATSGIREMEEAWASRRKIRYTAEFFKADPCSDEFRVQLQEKANQASFVCCLQNLQLCFETEERARKLLQNVSYLLKPGGYFFGITPDSSIIWGKHQKNVEAYHNRSGSMKPNVVPNCIRSENYVITFEVAEEKFPIFGKKYQLRFADDISSETHYLVHFPSLIGLAREAGLEYIEILNLIEFYDDNRTQFAGMLANAGPNLVDMRGRLLPRSHDVLGLYTTFIFQKHDPDSTPPLATPLPQDIDHELDAGQLTKNWMDRSGASRDPRTTTQKGILGPGPEDLRFSEAP